jgi:hypothetical protein
VPATAKQKGPAQCVTGLVRHVSAQHEMLELFAVVLELFLIELVLQEFCYDFCFSNLP